jgi:GTPase KRas
MLEILDTGEEYYTELGGQWIRYGEGFVLVYSITSRSSFEQTRAFRRQIQKMKELSGKDFPTGAGHLNSSGLSPLGSSDGGNVPVILVGNKSDKVTERQVSYQEGSTLARDIGCDFVEASAKTRTNVERAFYDVVRSLRRQRQQCSETERDRGGSRPSTDHIGGSTLFTKDKGGRRTDRGTCLCTIL